MLPHWEPCDSRPWVLTGLEMSSSNDQVETLPSQEGTMYHVTGFANYVDTHV